MNPPGHTEARIASEVRVLARALADLGFRLNGELAVDGNALFSPLSVGAGLAALLPGARSHTLEEFQSVLGLDWDPDQLVTVMPQLLDALRPRTRSEPVWDDDRGISEWQDVETYRLTLATALFVEKSYPLHTAYCDALTTAFRAEFFSLLFDQAEHAAKRINDWVRERTQGKIPRLVSAEDIDPLTRLVLANAVYFKAHWADQFSEHATQAQPFRLNPEVPGATVEVPMMRLTGTYRYSRDWKLGIQALRIPYEESLSMLVLLPAAGRFRDVASTLSLDLVDALRRAASPSLVRLELPRFELRHTLSLREALTNLGLATAFEAARADFAGITPSSEGLSFSQALHEAWVKVDETGTEAAAATAFALAALAEPGKEPEPIRFIVDRPFLFLILDELTDAVLFMGRVLDPS